jgi:hypothetical protein
LYHAYWDGTAADHSGNGNNGSVSGSASFVPGGLDFAAVPGTGLVSVTPAGSLYFGTGDFSLLGYIKGSGGAGQRVIYFGTYGATWIELVVSLFQNSPEIYHLLFQVYKVDGTLLYSISGGSFSGPTTWISFAYTVDRDVGAYTYLNAVPDLGPLGNLDPGNITGVTPMAIGNRGDLAEPLEGTIGELLMFNSFKSSADVLIYFNATKGRYGY